MKSLKLEDLYPRIFFSAVVAIGVTNSEGKYIIVNPTWCELLGYSEEEAKKLTVNDVTPIEDQDSSIVSFEFLVSEKGRSLRKKRRYQRKDGSVFWADLHVSTLYDDSGRVLGLLGVFVNIDKQVKAEMVQRELYSSLESLNLDLQKLARTDPLTGLYNRRVLEELIEGESTRSERTKRGFGIAIADIDNFKQINDTYGHDCGDKVLIELAKIFMAEIRSSDMMGRWGGEEFLFIFTETSCHGALKVIERIRRSEE
ncbi:MAG: sensor domain-containing diguanylate cyclase, partial [Candidatus Cloacimonetes bacterium]|nr:sensor domain-containing diguanylate cyclase [Candidatus Cloacimonadota bacterium]